MNTLTVKAFAGFTKLFIALSILLFLPAWSFDFREAWTFLVVFFVPVFFITVYLLQKEPELVERRLKAGPVAEKRTNQKIIQSLASLFFILLILVPGIDHRLHWSNVSPVFVIVADVGILLGLLIVFLTFKENSFTSAVIEVDAKQKVISTGPYAIVRHPMYSGALLFVFSTPIALGSWYGIPFALLIFVVIALRLFDEEKFLLENLSGYKEYYEQVHYRLIPRIW